MRIPLYPSLLKIRRQTVRWIIIHHTAELYDAPESKVDSSQIQMSGLAKGVLEKKTIDVNYNYVIDKIKDDYYPIVCRPSMYLCNWPDIPDDVNLRAIHIGLMGNYDLVVPTKRLYEVLAFRLINPMLKQYGLTPQKVKLHREVSTDSTISCPGDFIDPTVVISMIRRFVLR